MKTFCLATFVVLTLSAFTFSSEPAVESDPAPRIQVDVVGTLQTGVVAIGGETTGVVITCKNITWELEVPERLREAAEGMNGQVVQVKGELEKRQGVEIPARWIVTVTSMELAAAEAEEAGDEAGAGKEAGSGSRTR